jgi:RNA polymerase sigma factor (sigma-70 family)
MCRTDPPVFISQAPPAVGYRVVLGFAGLDGAEPMAVPVDNTLAGRLRLDLGARFSGPLRSYFLRRIRDRSQAEDLAQEVLLRMVRASDAELIEKPESYVFKVAANLLLDHQRQTLRNPTLRARSLDEAPEDGFIGWLVEDRSPERVLLGEATLREVSRALDELSELTRNVFILFRLENMMQKDIATLYGIAQSTVEKHVMRAMIHLAKRCGRE